jgi:hypothetical protein
VKFRTLELAFFYKAASLGFGVAKPWGDSEPYDFILDSGQRLWRVQLKSASHHFNRRYDVHVKRGKDEKVMYARAEIDILVVYLIPIHVWYVIPREKIEKKALYFYPYGGARHARHEAYREAWSLIGPANFGRFIPLWPLAKRPRPARISQSPLLKTRFSTPPAHVISSSQIVTLSEDSVRKANGSAVEGPCVAGLAENASGNSDHV